MKRALILLPALLAGCAIPSSEPRVATVAPAALGLTGAPAPLIDTEWWKSFGDPQLDGIVAEAIAGSPSLDAALARVRQADALLASRKAEDGPDVTLDGSGQVARLSGRYTIPPPYAGSTRFAGQVAANLGWNLDLFGRQKAAIAGAAASARAAALDAEAARLALAGAVVQTYVDLARAEAQIDLANRMIAARETSLRLTRVQVRNQLASRLQTSAAETLLAQARGALVRAQGARALAANALAALAGRGPDYAATIARAGLRFDAGLALPGTIPVDLISRRADIAAAQARIDAAAAGRQVARRAFYPNINLTAMAGFQAIGLGNLFSLDAGTAGAGPAIHLPLFDNGRLKADLSGATGALDLATADYNGQVVTAVREAADAIALIGNLKEQSAEQHRVVTGFAETARLNAVRVASGLDSKLGLIDTDVRLLEAQQADVNLSADAARQRVALILALGGGFDPKDKMQ